MKKDKKIPCLQTFWMMRFWAMMEPSPPEKTRRNTMGSRVTRRSVDHRRGRHRDILGSRH